MTGSVEGKRQAERSGFTVLTRMLKEGKHEVTFESRSEREEGANHEDPWGKGISVGGTARAKPPRWNVVPSPLPQL